MNSRVLAHVICRTLEIGLALGILSLALYVVH